MVIFKSCECTVDCPSVSRILQKLHSDESKQGSLLKGLFSKWNLSWNLNDGDGLYHVTGRWEMMQKAYDLFIAIQKASLFPEVYYDLTLLYQWCLDELMSNVSETDNSNYGADMHQTVSKCCNPVPEEEGKLQSHIAEIWVDEKESKNDVSKSMGSDPKRVEKECYRSELSREEGSDVKDILIPKSVQGNRNKSISKHKVLHRDRSRRSCNITGPGTKISRHLLDKISQRYKCIVCDRFFGSHAVLMQHRKVHSRVKSMACGNCGKKFYSKQSLNIHAKVHDVKDVSNKQMNSRDISCKYMEVVNKTSDNTRLKPNFTPNTNPPLKLTNMYEKCLLDSGYFSYKCQKCEYVSEGIDTSAIRDHIRRKHINTPPIYHCHRCDKKYKVKKDLNRHIKTHTMSFACTLCPKVYDYKLSLNRHIKVEHNSGTVFRPICQTCGKDFVNNTALKYHIQRNHMGTREMYTCEICGKHLLTPSSHKKHVKAHYESPKRETHPCEKCGEILGSKVALKYHIQAKHSEKRDFSCHVCGKSFKVQNVYNNHIKIHSERVRFVCKICEKSFLNKCSLKNHMLIHTEHGGKYCCDQPLCEKKYSDRKGLKRHLTKHHNIILTPRKAGRPPINSLIQEKTQCSQTEKVFKRTIIMEQDPETKVIIGNIRLVPNPAKIDNSKDGNCAR